jgi:soluble lytic murein transglycosylase-like protein
VQYLKFLLARFDLKRAIAAYNAGPGAVRKYNGVPPFRETQQYVKKVMKNFQD